MKKFTLILSIFSLFQFYQVNAQHGNLLNGIGAVNYGMGGTSTGNPSDVMGAIYWNPAGLNTFSKSELTISGTLLANKSVFSSTVPTPIGPVSGSTTSSANANVVPSLTFLYVPSEDSKWRFAFSALGMAGFSTKYEEGSQNPLLAPPPLGLGTTITEEYALVQLGLTATYAITDNLYFGITPTLNIASISGTPFLGVAPDIDVNGFAYYPGVENDKALGFGAQLSLFYKHESGFSAGFSYKSKQDFEEFELETIPSLESAASRTESLTVDLPAVTSFGLGYTKSKWKATVDLRLINFEDAEGLGPKGYGADGRALGFGWQNIVVIATGVQYKVSDKFPVRFGYSYGDSPIVDEDVIFSIAAPSSGEHGFHTGFGYALSEKVQADVSYYRGFANRVEGPLVFPTGAVPGASVGTELGTHFVSLNLSYKFVQ